MCIRDSVYPYGKVMDTETILYEPDENGIVRCINLAVFVYATAPDSISECKKMYDSSDWYSMLNACLLYTSRCV